VPNESDWITLTSKPHPTSTIVKPVKSQFFVSIIPEPTTWPNGFYNPKKTAATTTVAINPTTIMIIKAMTNVLMASVFSSSCFLLKSDHQLLMMRQFLLLVEVTSST
jgi:hypothetical protein